MEHVERIKRELKYSGKIVDFYTDTMQTPNGNLEEYDYIEHRKGASATVAVLPNGKLLMVRQWRNALDRFTLEIPAGARDSVDEPYIDCAARELEEETGYHPNKIEYLISIKTTVAFVNESVEVFLASDMVPTQQKLDPDEYVELEEHEVDTLIEMIYKGEIQDSKTVAGILAYHNKYRA
jgi:ADP-ribose pyrophosphatase